MYVGTFCTMPRNRKGEASYCPPRFLLITKMSRVAQIPSFELLLQLSISRLSISCVGIGHTESYHTKEQLPSKMVWYKRRIVIIPMAVVALVFVIAVPMAVIANKKSGSQVSASTNSPEDDEIPSVDYADDEDSERDVIFDSAAVSSAPSPTTHSDTSDPWEDLTPRLDISDAPSLVPSDAPSLVPSDSPSVVPSDLPSSAPSSVPSPTDAYLGKSDYPSLVPTGWGTPAPTTRDARFNKIVTESPTSRPALDSAHLGSDYPSLVPTGWGTPDPTTVAERMDQSPNSERQRRRRRRTV